MKAQPCSLFFLGKGGVGKSTCSALTAVAAAQNEANVLLVSLDPAHNQSDIFGSKLSDKPKKITKNLQVSELELAKWIRKYLHGVEEQVKRSYKYLTAMNLEHYFKVIKYSPGIEEYALLLAYEHILKEYRQMDYIIFDMPPTALTLRFFELPNISLVWLSHLQDLRREILKKREIITTIKIGKTEIQSDKIITKLDEQILAYERINSIFSDPKRTHINLVLNPDKLSLSESILIIERLRENDLKLKNVYLNKYQGTDSADIERKITDTPLLKIPQSAAPLLGLEILKVYLKENNISTPYNN